MCELYLWENCAEMPGCKGQVTKFVYHFVMSLSSCRVWSRMKSILKPHCRSVPKAQVWETAVLLTASDMWTIHDINQDNDHIYIYICIYICIYGFGYINSYNSDYTTRIPSYIIKPLRPQVAKEKEKQGARNMALGYAEAARFWGLSWDHCGTEACGNSQKNDVMILWWYYHLVMTNIAMENLHFK